MNLKIRSIWVASAVAIGTASLSWRGVAAAANGDPRLLVLLLILWGAVNLLVRGITQIGLEVYKNAEEQGLAQLRLIVTESVGRYSRRYRDHLTQLNWALNLRKIDPNNPSDIQLEAIFVEPVLQQQAVVTANPVPTQENILTINPEDLRDLTMPRMVMNEFSVWLHRIRKRWKQWRRRWLPTHALDIIQIRIVRILHRLGIVRGQLQQNLLSDTDDQDSPRVETRIVWHFMRYYRSHRMLILGAPGTGKSTLLRHMALVMSRPWWRRWLQRSPNKLPILLTLREVSAGLATNPNFTLLQAIRTSLGPTEIPAAFFKRRLINGRCIIMLDALDDLQSTPRAEVVKWVGQQIRDYGRCRFIVTSRPYAYEAKQLPWEGVMQLRVMPFTQLQTERFIEHWYKANRDTYAQPTPTDVTPRAKDLMQEIRRSATLLRLAGNPLLLTMIASLHRAQSDFLLERRVELYRRIWSYFLSERDDTVPFGAKEKQNVLEQLAYHMSIHKQRSITLQEADPLIQPALAPYALTMTTHDFLQWIERSSGLIVQEERQHYQFAHQTFQEFLTANHINTRGWLAVILEHLMNEWWQETIGLYCALTDNASPVVRACIDRDEIRALWLGRVFAKDAEFVDESTLRLLKMKERDWFESDDPRKRDMAAEAYLQERLSSMTSLGNTVEADLRDIPITHAEYQLFLKDHPTKVDYLQPSHWEGASFPVDQSLEPVVGVTGRAALAFCRWLSNFTEGCHYDLPFHQELAQHLPTTLLGYWVHYPPHGWRFEGELGDKAQFVEHINTLLQEDIALGQAHRLLPTALRHVVSSPPPNFAVDMELTRAMALGSETHLARDPLLERQIYLDRIHRRKLGDTYNPTTDLDLVLDLADDIDVAYDLYAREALTLTANHAKEMVRDLGQRLNGGTADDQPVDEVLRLIYDIAQAQATLIDLGLDRYLARRLNALTMWVLLQRASTLPTLHKRRWRHEAKSWHIFYLSFAAMELRRQGTFPAWESIRIVRRPST